MPSPLPVQNLTPENFARFGQLLRHQSLLDGYEVVATVESTGWLWALYTYGNKEVQVLECHPNSPMAIEPAQGLGLLLVAPPQQPQAIEAFVLDQGVWLKEGVWHNLLAITPKAAARVIQNRGLQTQFYQPHQTLRLGLFSS